NQMREMQEQQQMEMQPPPVPEALQPEQDPNMIPPGAQPLPPNEVVDPEQNQIPPPAGPGGADIQTGDPLEMPMNIIPVNTWDNHEVHVEVHNRFRKSQAFELLPEPIKEQFEYHV